MATFSSFSHNFPPHYHTILAIKMLPVTELMNIPDAIFIKSTQSSASYHRTNMTPLIIFLRTIEQNVTYGRHTELARFNLLIFTRGGDCLTSGQSYKSLMRFIDPNWDTNIVHKSPMRFIALFCSGLSPYRLRAYM